MAPASISRISTQPENRAHRRQTKRVIRRQRRPPICLAASSPNANPRSRGGVTGTKLEIRLEATRDPLSSSPFFRARENKTRKRWFETIVSIGRRTAISSEFPSSNTLSLSLPLSARSTAASVRDVFQGTYRSFWKYR